VAGKKEEGEGGGFKEFSVFGVGGGVEY